MSKKFIKLTLSGFSVVIVFFFFINGEVTAKKPTWDGTVHAPLKTAQRYDWSAPSDFFTRHEVGSIRYTHTSDSFKGVLELIGFKQEGPYVLTVDTNEGATLAEYECDVWNPWAEFYGETFIGGTNGCWGDNPYVDVKLFYLEQYDSNKNGFIDIDDYYDGTIPFDAPFLNGTYNLKFFVKLDWQLTSPSGNIMLMNDMTGNPKYGKVTKPRGFNYDKDLIIENGLPYFEVDPDNLAAEKLILADDAWCVASGECEAPDDDPGYQGITGVVFYSTLAETFEGTVVLSNTVTPPTPQPLQIKLEGLGSLSPYANSNEKLGYIGRWWNNNTNGNISDSQYEDVKDIHDVLGYVIFDGFDTSGTSKTFALDYSYHVLYNPERGSVTMEAGDYVAYFALTENIFKWRGIFLSENPLVFTIQSASP